MGFLLALFTMNEGLSYFLNAYLVAFMFAMSISLGCLFCLHHSVDPGRLGCGDAASGRNHINGNRAADAALFAHCPFGSLQEQCPLFLERFDGGGGERNSPEKSGYLDSNFFFIRYLVYSAIFIGLARYFFHTSLRQDKSGDPELTLQMERTSTWGAYLFAGSLTFAAVDWVMSLQPEWFSTIFGVYYFAGSAVACLSFLIIVLDDAPKPGPSAGCRYGGALSRSRQVDVRFYLFLGLHRLFPVLPDLVREYSGRELDSTWIERVDRSCKLVGLTYRWP